MTNTKIIYRFGLTALVLLHVVFAGSALKKLSPTFDEPVHLLAGYIALKTAHYRFLGLENPPATEILSALPLLFLNPTLPFPDISLLKKSGHSPQDQYQSAHQFLYENKIPHENLLAAGRAPQIAISVFFGIFLYFFVTKLAGPRAGLLAAGCWALSPTFIAHSALITNDLAFAVFFFTFFALADNLDRWPKRVGAGLALGLMVGSKFFCVVLLPCVLGLVAWKIYKKWKDSGQLDKIFTLQKKEIINWGWVVLIGFLTLWAIYQFTSLRYFERGIKLAFKRGMEGHPSFFWGQHGTQGWPLYYPISFLIKTALPILLGVIISGFLFWKKILTLPSRLVIPPLCVFIMVCISHKQIGHRYLLAIYPFIFVLVGVGLSHLKNRRLWIPIGLSIWLLIGTWRARPHFLSYFNELVGGSSQGYRYYTDSNVDWGQGMKELKNSLHPDDLKRGIYLSYFGVSDPGAYGIRFINVKPTSLVRFKDHAGDPDLNPQKLALSVTNLQGTYYEDKNLFSWVKNYPIQKRVADSIFIYDFSNEPEALEKLKGLTAQN